MGKFWGGVWEVLGIVWGRFWEVLGYMFDMFDGISGSVWEVFRRKKPIRKPIKNLRNLCSISFC